MLAAIIDDPFFPIFFTLATLILTPMIFLAVHRHSWPWHGAIGLIASVSFVLTLTLSPRWHYGAPSGASLENWFGYPKNCQLYWSGNLGITELPLLTQGSLNSLLFVPTGLLIGLFAKRRGTALVAILIGPFAIELAQGMLPPLNRHCTMNDFVDNVTGGVAALLIGMIIRFVYSKRYQKHRNTGTMKSVV